MAADGAAVGIREIELGCSDGVKDGRNEGNAVLATNTGIEGTVEGSELLKEVGAVEGTNDIDDLRIIKKNGIVLFHVVFISHYVSCIELETILMILRNSYTIHICINLVYIQSTYIYIYVYRCIHV